MYRWISGANKVLVQRKKMKEINPEIERSSEKPPVGRIKRRLLKLLIVLFSLGILTLGGWFWLTHYLEKRLNQAVTDAGLQISYKAVHFHLFPPGISLKDVHLTSAKSDSVFDFDADHARASLEWGKILSGRFLEFSNLDVRDGNVLFYAQDTIHDSLPTPPKKKSKPQSWQIDRIELRNIGIGASGEKGGQLKIQSLSGSLSAQYADSGYQYSLLKRPLKFLVTDCELPTAFKYHELKADTLAYNMEVQTFRAVGIRLKPKVSCDYIDQNEPFITLLAQFSAPEIVVSGIQWAFTDSLRWRATKMEMTSPVVTLVQNKERPLKPGVRPMPQAWIEAVPFLFIVDTIHACDAALNYTFTPDDAAVQGRVAIDKWDLLWLGYGNDCTRARTFSVKTKMRWMQSVWMTGEAIMNYDDPNYGFVVNGNFGQGDFSRFNPVMEASEGFKFLSGHCTGLRFSMKGDDKQCRGKMWLEYEDVKIGFGDHSDDKVKGEPKDKVKGDPKGKAKGDLKGKVKGRDKTKGDLQDKAKGKGKHPKKDKIKDSDRKQLLKAFIVNHILIRKGTKGEVVELEVSAVRNQQQSIIAFWLKWLMSGIMSGLKR